MSTLHKPDAFLSLTFLPHFHSSLPPFPDFATAIKFLFNPLAFFLYFMYHMVTNGWMPPSPSRSCLILGLPVGRFLFPRQAGGLVNRLLSDSRIAAIIPPCPTGRGAVRLARFHGVQEVPGSIPGAPTGDRLHRCLTDVSGLWLTIFDFCPNRGLLAKFSFI